MLRLKLIRKSLPVHNPGKAKYQKILFKNEKGEKLRLTLFGLDIGFYENILEEDKVYDITDAVLKDGNAAYSPYPQEKQLFFKQSTSVMFFDGDDASDLFVPHYVSLADVGSSVIGNHTFDVVVALLKVEEPRNIQTRTGRFVDTCKIFMTDDSCDKVFCVTLWEAMAHDVQQVVDLDSAKCVVAFLGLKTGLFRGELSLSGGFESRVVLSPKGSRPDAMRKWFGEAKESILGRLSCIGNLAPDVPTIQETSLADLYAKKVVDLEEGCVFKINVFIPTFEFHDIRTSVGCGLCGRFCEFPLAKRFHCDGCEEPAVASAKLYFDFKGYDGTGNIFLSAQTRTAENILGVKAHIFHTKTAEERVSFLSTVKNALPAKKLPLVVSPVSPLLTDHGIVKWTLKYMEI